MVDRSADQMVGFPIQVHTLGRREPARVRREVYMAAYEVYAHVYGPQPALIEGSCRGGFGIGELTGFLYARAFPKAEWAQRVDEAFVGMRGLS